jgi:hypothetical protein
MSDDGKKPFLVAFGYLKAGYWGVMYARSPAEIQAKWPELVIADKRPEWMTGDDYSKYLARAYDIDGDPHGILNMILNSRHHEQ